MGKVSPISPEAVPAEISDDEMIVTLTVAELRALIRGIVRAEIKAGIKPQAPADDKLLSVAEACDLLGKSRDWLYHNAKTLPFTRRHGRSLMFSSNGLQRYIESAKFSVK